MNEDGGQWQYKPDGQTAVQQSSAPATEANPQSAARSSQDTTVAWTASEYIDHTRGAGWYVALVAGTALLGVAVYLVTKDYFTIGIVVLTGLIIWVFSTHKPKQVSYELSVTGIKAGEKSYPYSLFKSFTIIRENALCSLNLIPIKRFMPPLSIYFDPSQEQKIADIVGSHLAYEEGGLDTIEKISRRLRL